MESQLWQSNSEYIPIEIKLQKGRDNVLYISEGILHCQNRTIANLGRKLRRKQDMPHEQYIRIILFVKPARRLLSI